MRRFANASFIAGAALLAFIVACAMLSFVWTPFDPTHIDMARALSPPTGAHPFGADSLGRDSLSMTMAGARASLGAALGAVAIGFFTGAPLGMIAAIRGGALDNLIMRASDVIFAFPALLLAILFAAVFGQSGLTAAIAIGVFNIPVFARIVRGAGRALLRRDFVLAARASGLSRMEIALRHIAPNLVDQALVQIATQLSVAVLAEAALSYIGVGVQAPTPSWGRMLNDAQIFIFTAPHLALAPGAALFATVLSFSLIADGLRRGFATRASLTP